MNKIKIFYTLIIFIMILLLLLCFYEIFSLQKDISVCKETINVLKASEDSNSLQKEEQIINRNKKKIEQCLSDNTKDLSGKVSYGVHLYDESYYYVKNDEKFKSASIIKLFIMELAYDQIAKGNIDKDLPISGFALETLIESMITVSDNNATNLLIDYFGMEQINKFLAEQGYKNTIIERKMLDYDAIKIGKDNYTSVGDVMLFLDKMYEAKESYPYSKMVEIMKKQKVSTKIRKNMPASVEIANKTGELSNVENDIGIVFTEQVDYALVFLTNDSQSEKARDAISKVAKEIYDLIRE